MNARHTFTITATATLLAGTAALADLSHDTAPTPGGFVQACAGRQFTSGPPWPGIDFFPYFGHPDSDLHESAFSGVDAASASAAYQDGNYSNGSSGTLGMGYASLIANNDAPNNSAFAAALMNGCFGDTFLITSPGLDGQLGYLQFELHADGTVSAAGFAGAAGLLVTGYVDDLQMGVNEFFDPGNSDLLTSGFQYGNWGIASFGNPPSVSRDVDGVTTFAAEFTFGTPFDLSICARCQAGMRSASGVSGNSQATADFENGFSWGGVTAVYHNGAPVDDVTMQSNSGFDWTNAVNPPDVADLNQDGAVDVDDLLQLLAAWGTPDADITGDGTTDVDDLLALLAAWG